MVIVNNNCKRVMKNPNWEQEVSARNTWTVISGEQDDSGNRGRGEETHMSTSLNLRPNKEDRPLSGLNGSGNTHFEEHANTSANGLSRDLQDGATAFKLNKGSVSANGLDQSEANQQSPDQPKGQRNSRSKNRTHQSTVMKYSGLIIAASSPEISKTIRPLPGQENMSQELLESDDSMDEFS